MRMMIGHLEGKALCIKYAIHFDIRKHIKILTQSYSINMPDTPSLSILLDEKSMARIVRKILNKDTEQALSESEQPVQYPSSRNSGRHYQGKEEDCICCICSK